MKNREKLFILVLALICVFGIICVAAPQNSYAALSSSNFVLSSGNIAESDVNSTSSDNYVLSSQVATVGIIASSASFQTLPPLLAATTFCGNDTKETGEECDGSDFENVTCSDYGYDSGSLVCSSACLIDSAGCFNQSSGGGRGSGTVSPSQEPEEEEQDLNFGESSLEKYLEELIKVAQEKDLPCKPEEEPEEELTKIILPPAEREIIKKSVEEKIEEPHKSAEEEIRKTIDQTPVFFGELTSDKKYRAVVLDAKGNLIETQTIFTDKHGRFVFETQTPINSGSKGSLKIIDPDKEKAVETSYLFEITEQKEGYSRIKLISFGDKALDFSADSFAELQVELHETPGEPLDLGVIEIKESNAIKGYAAPFAEIVAYFQSEVVIIKTRADENGYFELKIPAGFKSGKRSVIISQKFSDGIVSDNLSYFFELDSRDRQINWQKIIMYLIAILSFVLVNFSYYVFRLEMKKRNTNKSE